MSNDDLEREWMPPSEEAKEAAAQPPARVPGAENLPDEVRDGDAGAYEDKEP